MTLIEQVARYLQSALGASILVTYGYQPQDPARCATVYATDTRRAGDADGARIQVLIRAPDAGSAIPAQDAERVIDALDDFTGLFCSGGDYIVRVRLESGASQIGADQNNRQQYSANFRIWYC